MVFLRGWYVALLFFTCNFIKKQRPVPAGENKDCNLGGLVLD
jgi:hypothetical protein